MYCATMWTTSGRIKLVEKGALTDANLSPLVCSTVRVGCCAGAEAMSAEKTERHDKMKLLYMD